jgi:phosphopantothenoylcysteine synthetase/decarboxylase
MNVIVTAGPSYEPMDEVRRLTNFSTGELGVLLANRLAQAGHDVFCFRGVNATYAGALENCRHLPFTTNADLLDQLAALSRAHDMHAVFHAAALCDFKVARVENAQGQRFDSPKIDSRAGELTIHLEPAPKVIGELRRLFPSALLVGWKYELAGTRADALARAWRQIASNHSDACVLNGRAWGSGFVLCTPPDQLREIRDKAELVEFLPGWLEKRLRDGGKANG